MTQLPDRMTTSEVADAFGVSEETVRRWTRAGQLPSQPLPSGRVVYLRRQIMPLVPGSAAVLLQEQQP